MTTPSLENVAVMGAGAVGCYFGAMLARGGAQVRLIGRPALVDAVMRDGLRFDGIDFKGRIDLSATTDAAGVAGAGLVLFSVKSPDTETAARAIAPHLAPGASYSACRTASTMSSVCVRRSRTSSCRRSSMWRQKFRRPACCAIMAAAISSSASSVRSKPTSH